MNKLNGKNIVRYAAIGSYLLSASYLLGSAEEGQPVYPPENQPVRAMTEEERQLVDVVENGYRKAVRALIAESADVNVSDNDGDTPLHLAALKGHLEVIKALRAASGIEVTQTVDGETALDIALESQERSQTQESQATVDLLRERGGKTGAEIAAEEEEDDDDDESQSE